MVSSSLVVDQGAVIRQARVPLALIPAYNEARHIGDVVTEAARFVDSVLVVDDGSSDATASVAAEAGAEVRRLSPNRGKGAALAHGFEIARAEGFPAVVTLDADGQHDPAEIPIFSEAWQAQSADLVIGHRSMAGMPLQRRVANVSGRHLLRWSTGLDLLDNQSGYRLLSSAAVDRATPTRTDFAFEVEQILLAIERGLTVTWVPIRTIYGTETSHFHPFHDSLAFVSLVLQLRRRRM